MNKSDVNTILTFLKQLKVKFTEKYVKEVYKTHPYKNTLFGVSDILSKYNIKTVGYKVTEEEKLNNFSTPFMTNIANKLSVVIDINDNEITYLDNNKKRTIPTNDFYSLSNRVILVANSNKEAIEPNYILNKRNEIFTSLRNKALLVLIFLITILAIISNKSYLDIGLASLIAINLMGIYISFLLLQKQLQISHEQADKICSFMKYGCESILNSSAAKFMGVIGWSEIGLGYFIANLFICFFLPPFIPYLSLINCCTLLYSLWSIWYQKFIAKEWCALCLIVQTLFWLTFIINISTNYLYIPNFLFSDIITLIAILSIPVILINIALSYWIKEEKLLELQLKQNYMKMDIGIFKSKLESQLQINVNKDTSKILWGNKDAEILLTIVTNPHCNPCAKTHKQVNELLNRAEDKICIQYIFTSFSKELESSSHFLIATYLSDEMTLEEKKYIYNEWFEHGKNNKEIFFEKYNIDLLDPSVLEEYEKHQVWDGKAQIAGTPTIMINGYELPEEYNIQDIAHFTDLK